MQRLPGRAVAIALLLLGLGTPGCLSFGAIYGGPRPRPHVKGELDRALDARDLRLTMDVDCREWHGSGCWEAGLIIREMLGELEVLWEKEGEPGPTHEVVFLLAGTGTGVGLSHIIAIPTLWTLIPAAASGDTEIGGILVATEPSASHEGASARMRDLFEKMSGTESYLDGKPVVADSTRVMATSYSAYSARYRGSALLPSAWIGGRGERFVSFPGSWLPEADRFRPWRRRSIEAAARQVLLGLVQTLPKGDSAPTSETKVEPPDATSGTEPSHSP